MIAELLSAVLVAGTVLAPNPPSPTGLDWQPCAGAPDVQCATLEVPVDWAHPDGPTTYLGLSKRPAKDPAHRLGAIVVNPGGPGSSGANLVKYEYPFTEPVNQRFDAIGLDARGVRNSQQVLCDPDLYNEEVEAWNPRNQAEFDHLIDLNHRLAADCRAHTGPLADHMDSLQSAHDLEAVRVALGEGKLNFVGYSYGTMMGQQYAELYPDHIRAMVNDGNMDHSIRTPWEWAFQEMKAQEDNFVAFADWCDTTSTCVLYGQDTRSVFAGLKQRARAGTLVDPATGQPMDFYDLTLVTFDAYLPVQWPDLARRLQSLRDGTPSARLLAEPTNQVSFAVQCEDWDIDVHSLGEYNALRTRLSERFPVTEWSIYVGDTSRCVGTPLPVTNPQHTLKVRNAPPLVMIGNVHDPATPLRWSQVAARQSGSHLITYEGWGHTAYFSGEQESPCVNAAVEAYLIDLTVPPDGLTCPNASVMP